MLEECAIAGQHEALLGVIQTLAGISHASPILDLGCGTGAWLKRLYDAGYRNLYRVTTIARHSGTTRYSIDFRTVNIAEKCGLVRADVWLLLRKYRNTSSTKTRRTLVMA